MDGSDPRVQPGAYVTDDRQLCEIVAFSNDSVLMECCRTGNRYRLVAGLFEQQFRLVQSAPAVPDAL